MGFSRQEYWSGLPLPSLGRKIMTNLDSIFKNRGVTLPTNVHPVKAMVFPVVMYGCESWTVKKAEHRRIDAFDLWCWRRLLRVPWTARRSNQSILKVISPWCSLKAETPVLWPPHAKSWKRLWCWEGLGEGGEEDDRGWDICMALLTWWTWFGWTEGVGDGQGGLACCYSWVCKDSDTTEWTALNWTEVTYHA